MKGKIAFLALAVAILTTGTAHARDQIRIVGSSTVYPFATVVAENFGKTTNYSTPIIESTGSGGGFKLFCSGVGVEHPDITNASRAIKKSEIEKCAANGVTDISEVIIGYDGIVVAHAKTADDFELSTRDIFLALAKMIPDGNGGLKENDNVTWQDVRSDLPAIKIEVLGPPPTSGTRDAFVELAMQSGAKTFPELADLKKKDKKQFKAVAHSIREDGGYIEAGENDVLIVRKLEANPNAVGIFGFSFLDQNLDKVKGVAIEGVVPEFEAIADQSYPISRPLFFYVKNEHVGVIPGITEYLSAFVRESAEGGSLEDKGLIPLPDSERATMVHPLKK